MIAPFIVEYVPNHPVGVECGIVNDLQQLIDLIKKAEEVTGYNPNMQLNEILKEMINTRSELRSLLVRMNA